MSVSVASVVAVVAVLLAAVAVLLGASESAQAAFPGKNGKIAYSTGGDIWTMNPDGSGQTKLTDTTTGDGFAPQWSANGRKILFNLCSGPDPGYCDGEIHRMNADGSREVPLTTSQDWWPSWFPTSNKIAFTDYGGPGELGIYTMTFDASRNPTGRTLLVGYPDPGGDCPEVSPDGTKIAFLSYRDGEGRGLWVMRAAPEGPNNRPVKLAEYVREDQCSGFDWSPDGKRIAYTPNRTYPDGTLKPSNVWVMNADGTAKTAITKTPDVSETQPAFSPDGKKIVFSSYRDGSTDVWKMGADGSDPTQLTDSPTFEGQRGEEADFQGVLQLRSTGAGRVDHGRIEHPVDLRKPRLLVRVVLERRSFGEARGGTLPAGRVVRGQGQILRTRREIAEPEERSKSCAGARNASCSQRLGCNRRVRRGREHVQLARDRSSFAITARGSI